MADNLQVNQGTGPAVRTLEDASSIHWPVGIVAYAQSVGTPDVLIIPTAQTLGDTLANPQVLLHGACQLVFDGAQWVRVRGDAANGLDVDVTRLPVSSRDFDTGAGTENVLLAGLAVPGAGGAQIVGTASSPLRVDPTGTTTQPVTGTVTAIQGGNWDVGLLAGDNNIGNVDVLTLPSTTVAGTTAVTLDYDTGAGTQQMLMVGIAIPAAGGAVAGGTATNPLRVDPTGTTTQPVSGIVTATQGGAWDINTLAGSTVAHGAADSANPHKVGIVATGGLSAQTPVAAGQRSNCYGTLDGKLIQQPYCAPQDEVDGLASSTTTADTVVLAAQGVGIRTHVSTIVVSNSSATDVEVSIKNGVTERMRLPVPQKGGVIVNLPVHLRGNENTAWSFASSAAATTITVTMIGYKSKV